VAALAELDDEGLTEEVGERAIVFAEDGLRVVFEELLGFPSLDEEVFAVGREHLIAV
jgi:hypothetical protein